MRNNGVAQPSGLSGPQNSSDYYVTVSLQRTSVIDSYIEVSKDPARYTLVWQKVNPYFIDMGMFQQTSSVEEIRTVAEKYNITINR